MAIFNSYVKLPEGNMGILDYFRMNMMNSWGFHEEWRLKAIDKTGFFRHGELLNQTWGFYE